MSVDTKDEIPKVAFFYKSRKKVYLRQNYGRGVSRMHTYDRREVYFFPHNADFRMTALQLAKKNYLKSSSFLTERMCWKRLTVSVRSRRKN